MKKIVFRCDRSNRRSLAAFRGCASCASLAPGARWKVPRPEGPKNYRTASDTVSRPGRHLRILPRPGEVYLLSPTHLSALYWFSSSFDGARSNPPGVGLSGEDLWDFVTLSTYVPTYAADGRRLRSYSLSAIERLHKMSMVAVRRNRYGKIVAAFFRHSDGANPILCSAHTGTRYSDLVRVGPDTRAWQLRGFIQRQDLEAVLGEKLATKEELDLYVRRIFRAVPLSCITTRQPELPTKKTPAKVVSIDTGRRKPRPVPYDAGRKVAA